MNAVFCGENTEQFKRIFSAETVERIGEKLSLHSEAVTKADILKNPEYFSGTEYLFSTWGMPVFTEEEIGKYLPRLKAVFYAAGSVQSFARPFLRSGVKVFSAWQANAVPVAEYTMAQILLANKGFFRERGIRSPEDYGGAQKDTETFPGNYDTAVGLLSYGAIASKVAKMLRNFRLDVKIWSWALTAEAVLSDGFELCPIEEIFSQCSVISNHLANTDETAGMIDYRLLSRMKPYATFINTGRGRQVVEADLARVLTERPDLTAILDVTEPEPPEEDSPLYSLPNCIITTHIAGSLGNEVRRMGVYMADELERYLKGEKCPFEVTAEMLETMA